MKITDSEIIKSGEKELLDAITADLDWGAIEDIFIKNHGLEIEEDIEYQKGDIVSYQDQIAYQLEFSVKVGLSVLLDREGNYLSVAVSGQQGNSEVSGEKTGEEIENVTDKVENFQGNEPPGESKNDYLEALTELDAVEMPDGSETETEQSSKMGTPEDYINKHSDNAEEQPAA